MEQDSSVGTGARGTDLVAWLREVVASHAALLAQQLARIRGQSDLDPGGMVYRLGANRKQLGVAPVVLPVTVQQRQFNQWRPLVSAGLFLAGTSLVVPGALMEEDERPVMVSVGAALGILAIVDGFMAYHAYRRHGEYLDPQTVHLMAQLEGHEDKEASYTIPPSQSEVMKLKLRAAAPVVRARPVELAHLGNINLGDPIYVKDLPDGEYELVLESPRGTTSRPRSAYAREGALELDSNFGSASTFRKFVAGEGAGRWSFELKSRKIKGAQTSYRGSFDLMVDWHPYLELGGVRKPGGIYLIPDIDKVRLGIANLDVVDTVFRDFSFYLDHHIPGYHDALTSKLPGIGLSGRFRYQAMVSRQRLTRPLPLLKVFDRFPKHKHGHELLLVVCPQKDRNKPDHGYDARVCRQLLFTLRKPEPKGRRLKPQPSPVPAKVPPAVTGTRPSSGKPEPACGAGADSRSEGSSSSPAAQADKPSSGPADTARTARRRCRASRRSWPSRERVTFVGSPGLRQNGAYRISNCNLEMRFYWTPSSNRWKSWYDGKDDPKVRVYILKARDLKDCDSLDQGKVDMRLVRVTRGCQNANQISFPVPEPGRYIIVYDTGRDGLFNEGADVYNGDGKTGGFEVFAQCDQQEVASRRRILNRLSGRLLTSVGQFRGDVVDPQTKVGGLPLTRKVDRVIGTVKLRFSSKYEKGWTSLNRRRWSDIHTYTQLVMHLLTAQKMDQRWEPKYRYRLKVKIVGNADRHEIASAGLRFRRAVRRDALLQKAAAHCGIVGTVTSNRSLACLRANYLLMSLLDRLGMTIEQWAAARQAPSRKLPSLIIEREERTTTIHTGKRHRGFELEVSLIRR